MSLAVFFGLSAAVLYGATEFVGRFSSRSVGVLRTMFYGQLLIAGLLTIYLWVRGFDLNKSAVSWVILSVTTFILLGATSLLYRGLAVGKLAVVSPVVACYGAVTALLSVLAGEDLSPSVAGGMVVALVGGILCATHSDATSRQTRAGPAHTGVAFACGAALAYGIGFWLLGRFAVPEFGSLLPTWFYCCCGICTLGAVAAARGRGLAPPRRHDFPVVAATALLGASGSVALAAAQATGEIAVATVLSSLASAVTVVLGKTVLKERVAIHGWAGLVLVVSGLMLLHQ